MKHKKKWECSLVEWLIIIVSFKLFVPVIVLEDDEKNNKQKTVDNIKFYEAVLDDDYDFHSECLFWQSTGIRTSLILSLY